MESVAQKPRYKIFALRIIDAAERLFADHGISEAPLQAIANEAGLANKYAVQYHFGSREGLVSALMDVRLAGIDERRQLLLDGLKRSGKLTVSALLRVIYQPIIDQVDADGKHRFAAILSAVKASPQYRPIWFNSRHLSAAAGAIDLLRAALPHLTEAEFYLRLDLCIEQFYSSVRLIDEPVTLKGDASVAVSEASMLIDIVITMNAAALKAPALIETDEDPR